MTKKQKVEDAFVTRIKWWRRPKSARRMNLFRRVWRIFRLLYIILVRMDASPHQIAFGFAIGVILGVFPTFGLGGPIAIALAFMFKLNKASTILGAMIMNPLTTVPIWTASAFIGSVIWQADFHLIMEQTRTGQIFKALSYSTMVYLTGNIILSAIMALAAYGLVFLLTRRYRVIRAGRRDSRRTNTLSS